MKRDGEQIKLNWFEAGLCDGARSLGFDDAVRQYHTLCEARERLTERVAYVVDPVHGYGEACQLLQNDWLIGRFEQVLGEIAASELISWRDGLDASGSE